MRRLTWTLTLLALCSNIRSSNARYSRHHKVIVSTSAPLFDSVVAFLEEPPFQNLNVLCKE